MLSLIVSAEGLLLFEELTMHSTVNPEGPGIMQYDASRGRTHIYTYIRVEGRTYTYRRIIIGIPGVGVLGGTTQRLMP
jgi:hypothetical protein